ncbi:MAG TPA: hypothetical protein VIK55_04860 [Paludibacter sp.]
MTKTFLFVMFVLFVRGCLKYSTLLNPKTVYNNVQFGYLDFKRNEITSQQMSANDKLDLMERYKSI